MSILYMKQKEYEHLHSLGALARYDVLQEGNYYRMEIDPYDLPLKDALAHVLLYLYEEKYLRRMLIQEFYFTEEQELEALIKYARFLLNDGDILEEVEVSDIHSERVKQIKQELHLYLVDAEALHLEGFFRFRLKQMWMSYNKIIENAIDEYMLEKEYRDYINYLRGLVRDRQMQVPYVHLFYREEENYLFLDERGKEMDFEQLYTYSKDSGDLDIMYDDQLISRLIAVNPNQIQLHNLHGNHHIAMSLKNIFEERLAICTGCSMCKEGMEHQG